MNKFQLNDGIDFTSFKLGQMVPEFEADSTYGLVRLTDYRGKWVILLSKPGDFCTGSAHEIKNFTDLFNKLRELNCELFGISGLDIHSPLTWSQSLREQYGVRIWFPIILDARHQLARILGMINPEDEAAGINRSIYIIDDKQILRSIVYYHAANSDTLHEVIRLVKELKRTDTCGIVTDDNWSPGNEWILAGLTAKNAKEREPGGMWHF
jgi:peroxiredoxin (alkyl hydroperoxide reductase subunit C)